LFLFRNKETRGPFDLLIATFKHMKDKRQLMLIPITMYSGFEQAFLTGDYTRVRTLALSFYIFHVTACFLVFTPFMSYFFLRNRSD